MDEAEARSAVGNTAMTLMDAFDQEILAVYAGAIREITIAYRVR